MPQESVVEGGAVAAVDELAASYRATGDLEVAVRLVDRRHEAALALAGGEGRAPWPPAYPDPFGDLDGRLPEIDAPALASDVLGGAVAHHGALIVRGLFDAERVRTGLDVVRRAGAARDGRGSDGDGWYRPFATGRSKDGVLRRLVAEQGGTWLADSPAATAHFLDELAAVGAVSAIAGHFGERPCISLQKSTLRQSAPVYQPLVAWHQDGSFLDADVRTMNVWLAFTPCGGDRPTPGLEVVPKRVPEVLPVDGLLTPHSISGELVAEVAADVGTTYPVFEPGDAVLFDERFLHRTHLTPGMTHERVALECWFFAPSHTASNYVPFLV